MPLQDVGVRAVIEGLASFQSGMKSMQQGVNKFAADVGAAGRSMALLGAPLVAIGIVGVKAFANLEKTMARVQAVSGATEDEFQSLEKVAREMGRTTIFSATESAEALAFMSQAGLDAADQVDALPKVLELAAAGMLDIAQAADIVTNVMAGAGLEVEDLGRANDVLTVAFTSANTNLQQLAQGFKFVGPVASSAGVSFEETTAALALMGNAGLQATIAGTGLRGIISKLLNPTKEAAATIERLGLEAFDSSGKMRPLVDIIAQLETQGDITREVLEIFGDRAGPAMSVLVSQGSEALGNLTGEMLVSSGTASGIAAKQMDTFAGQMAELRAAIESVSIEIGKVLVPVLGDMIDAVRPALEAVARFAEANPKLTVTVIAVGAAISALGIVLIGVGAVLPGLTAAAGLLAGALTGVGAAVALITGPVGLTILAIAGLVTAMLIFRDQFAQVFDFIGKALEFWLNNTWIPVINGIISTLNLLPKVSIPTIKKLDLELGKAFLSVADKADDAIDKIKGLIPAFGSAAKAAEPLIDEMAELGPRTREAAESFDPVFNDAIETSRVRLGTFAVATSDAVDQMLELGRVEESLIPLIRPFTHEVDQAALATQRWAFNVEQLGGILGVKLPKNLDVFTNAQLATEQGAILARSAFEKEQAALAALGDEFDEVALRMQNLTERGQQLQAMSLGGLPFPTAQDIFESFIAAGLGEELARQAAAAFGAFVTPGQGGPEAQFASGVLAGMSNITNTVPSSIDRPSSVDSHDATFNIDAHYTTPQEPRGIRDDLETITQMMR